LFVIYCIQSSYDNCHFRPFVEEKLIVIYISQNYTSNECYY